MKKSSFIQNRIESFRFAFTGLKDILMTEHNAWVHVAFTVVIVLLSLWLKVEPAEFVLILICIVLVWIAETFNTVLEIVIDIVSPEYTKAAKRVKDMAAAAVLIASMGAFLAGIIILGPPLAIKFGL